MRSQRQATASTLDLRSFVSAAVFPRWSSRQLEVAAMPGGQTQMAVLQKNLGTSQKTSLTIPSQKWTTLGTWQRLRASWCP
uniref:Alternative protein BCORL1 n=1 Tax=Homo sapiens TaxID=9606 RepID=L8EB38_HUMAN|nr:alternative protein BCORL1 [Homo sapiens]